MKTAFRNVRRLIRHPVPTYSFLAALYLLLIFSLPASQATMQTYSLSPAEYRITLLAVSLPSLVVWYVAFVGYDRLRQYAAMVGGAPEGPHFKALAKGCGWLAWGLPIAAFSNLVFLAVAGQHPGFHAAAIIITNYLSLFLPLVAFSYIGTASRGLTNSAKLRLSLASTRLIMLVFVTAGVLYCWLIFRQVDVSSLATTANPYLLPVWLMVLTVIIPYLYAWFLGLLAAYEITLFSQKVPGILYRRALQLLVGGLLAVIFSSIALQYLNAIQPRVGYLVFNYRLLLILLFRVIGGVGFVLLIIGASRLKKIEEV